MHDVHVDDKGQFKSPISNFIFFCILLLFLISEIHSQVDFMVYNGKNWNYSGNDICATYSSNNQGLALINAFSFFSCYDFTGALQNLWQKKVTLDSSWSSITKLFLRHSTYCRDQGSGSVTSLSELSEVDQGSWFSLVSSAKQHHIII